MNPFTGNGATGQTFTFNFSGPHGGSWSGNPFHSGGFMGGGPVVNPTRPPERAVNTPPPRPVRKRTIADFILDGACGVTALFTDANGKEQARDFPRIPEGLAYPSTAHTLLPLRRFVTGCGYRIDGLA